MTKNSQTQNFNITGGAMAARPPARRSAPEAAPTKSVRRPAWELKMLADGFDERAIEAARRVAAPTKRSRRTAPPAAVRGWTVAGALRRGEI